MSYKANTVGPTVKQEPQVPFSVSGGLSARHGVLVKQEPSEGTMAALLTDAANSVGKASGSESAVKKDEHLGVHGEDIKPNVKAQLAYDGTFGILPDDVDASMAGGNGDPGLGQAVQIAPASNGDARKYTLYQSPEEIIYTPESALKEGHGMVHTIKECVKSINQGSKMRQDVWLRELEGLQNQGTPTTLIAVCGATGAGKSSILNAVLDDNIVPTSGMRACTAVVTEISYHTKKTIDADVSFLSHADWRSELKLLVEDLVDEDGNIKSVKNLQNEAGIAWSKVHAVYPMISPERIGKMSVDQIMAADTRIDRILGTTKRVVANTSKEFGKEIAKYIDSKNQKRGDKGKKDDKKAPASAKSGNTLMALVRKKATAQAMVLQTGESEPNNGAASGSGNGRANNGEPNVEALELWPLIRSVKVRCNAAALSTGAVLCDLPGTADANAARNSIAKNYIMNCNCIWILAPITRAVDDRTARDLMGDAFKTQLLNGSYDSGTITFIASKTDDVSCSEIIQALSLYDDPELEAIEATLYQILQDEKTAKRQKLAADEIIAGTADVLKTVRAHISEYKEHIEALKNGNLFTPLLTAPGGAARASKRSSKGKKRKRLGGGKKGSPKRQRTDDSDADIERELALDSDADADSLDDFIANDSEAESDVNDEGGDDFDADRESNAGESGSDRQNEDPNMELQEDATIENITAKLTEAHEAMELGVQQKKAASEDRKNAINALTNLKKAKLKAQRQKNCFCSLKRSEFSIDVLREDFRTGLKGMDDAAAEEKDPDSFNPEKDLRDYASINLPVFTASARDYVRLKKQVKGDGDPVCFSDVKDTGIPALQDWCRHLTVASRERSARVFLHSIKTFATSVQSYLMAGEGVTGADRQVLRDLYETSLADGALDMGNEDESDEEEYDEYGYPVPRAFDAAPGTDGLKRDKHGNVVGITAQLVTAFTKVINDCVIGLQDRFKDGLEEKCQVGAAAASAVETSDQIASSMHWATYRATLRRDGTWRVDINEELATPMSKAIASSWGRVFEADLFASFQQSADKAIIKLLKEVEASCPSALKERAAMQSEVSMNESKLAMEKIAGIVDEALQSQQKDISRSLVPHVRSSLKEGYDEAMYERGPGSVARQKASFHAYVNSHKDHIFIGGAESVMSKLNAVAEAVGVVLAEKLLELAEKIEVSIAVLWEGGGDDPAEIKARQVVVTHVNEIIGQAALWLEAERRDSSLGV